MARALIFRTLLLPLLLLAACGQNTAVAPDDASAGDDDMFLTCDTDTRALPYHPGMEVDSSASPPVFAVKLLESTPGPPSKGRNRWTIEIDELSTGAPLDDLTLTVMPYMPDHQHGTTPVTVTAAGSGTYALWPVNLYMSGIWQVRFTIIAPDLAGGTTDTAVIPICIP